MPGVARILLLVISSIILLYTSGSDDEDVNGSSKNLRATVFQSASSTLRQAAAASNHIADDSREWPDTFDPEAYLDYNPDVALGLTGLSRQEKHELAWIHYEDYGWKEKRLYSRVPVVFG